MSSRSPPADLCTTTAQHKPTRRLRHIRCIIARNLTSLPPVLIPNHTAESESDVLPPSNGNAGEPTAASSAAIEKLSLSHLYNRRRKSSHGSYGTTSRRTSSTTSAQRLFHERYSKVVSTSTAQLVSAYYTLSDIPEAGTAEEEEEDENDMAPFYISEVTEGSNNPPWDALDRSSMTPTAPWSASRIKVRVFVKQPHEERYRTALQRTVDLRALTFVGRDISDSNRKFPPDTIILAFDDGFYLPGSHSEANLHARAPPKPKAPVSSVLSYNYDSVLAILAAQKEISSVNADVAGIAATADDILSRRQVASASLRECERLRYSAATLRQRIDSENLALADLKAEIERQRAAAASSRAQLHEQWAANDASLQAVQTAFAQLDDQKLDTRRMRRQLRARQRELILEAATIYLIEPPPLPPAQPPSKGPAQQLFHTIRGIRLPNSEFTGHDDEMVATALGHTSHLICLLAFYFQIPLRYPLMPMSSRSSVVDTVSEHYAGSKHFPLYSRGVERMRFDYGVFLLNKDVEQLMNHMHLAVSNLRCTLPNLLAIIEEVRRRSEGATGEQEPVGMQEATDKARHEAASGAEIPAVLRNFTSDECAASKSGNSLVVVNDIGLSAP
ncbi:hypothetical protein HDU87_002711 [Geranomyces variabilis]|uniref:Autophagy-related protein 14 n=1 Tax=Geranomyces variabilis TaxID=109894 RepID=A0AAD5TS27_9FUNG|nr:hypothetical protein HDU87_002711 [Geranomyces variabilis]